MRLWITIFLKFLLLKLNNKNKNVVLSKLINTNFWLNKINRELIYMLVCSALALQNCRGMFIILK